MMVNCQRCGTEIPPDRLEILPDTQLCVGCSSEVGGDWEVTVVEENFDDVICSKPVIQKTKRVIDPLTGDEIVRRRKNRP